MDCGYMAPFMTGLQDVAQLLFVDLLGSGRSDWVDPQTLTLESWAADVIALADVLGLHKPVLFGHSFGGFVAMAAAIRAPDRFGGLITCNTMAASTMYEDADGPTLAKRATAEVRAASERFWGGDQSPEAGAEYVLLAFPYYFGPGHEHLAEGILPMSFIRNDVSDRWFKDLSAGYDLRPALGGISSPTMVMTGAFDWVCSPAAARDIVAHIPDAELQIIEGAAHFPFVEELDAFNRAVRSFLERRVQSPEPYPSPGSPDWLATT